LSRSRSLCGRGSTGHSRSLTIGFCRAVLPATTF
jgi:hypothetical protein